MTDPISQRGVHGKLSHADVGRSDRDLTSRKVSEGAASRNVRVIYKGLEGNAFPLENCFENRRGQAVGGVFLIGRMFNENSPSEHGTVGGVGLFGEVGVKGVAVVGRKGKAVCKLLEKSAFGNSET